MVVSAPQSQSQLPPQPEPFSAEEDAFKRNTDCVYFLASPLTCKKGSECEYRHSDVARVNPRDCYFWLHANCLNPKCGFRHPPLDGLLGTQVPTSIGPSAPVPQIAVAPDPHAQSASTTPGVPCIFFQKGFCLKGDWCPFLHMPNSMSNKPWVPVTATDPKTQKKTSSGPHEKPTQQKMTAPENVTKIFNGPAVVKSSYPTDYFPPKIESSITRTETQTDGVTELDGFRNSTSTSKGNPVNWPICIQQSCHLDDPEPEPEYGNSKDNDEISRELSPGFDVLVDDDLRDSDYYTGDDRYGLSRDHEVQNEYDIDHPNEYSVIDERYQGLPIGYDSHDNQRERYSYEHRGALSERELVGPHVEPDLYQRTYVINRVDEVDLRQRLVKHEKRNGLRSIISHENACDMDRGYQGPLRENTISSRLSGRIGLPRSSLSAYNRHRSRLSPLRAIDSEPQGRISDGVSRRVDKSLNNRWRNYRGLYATRDGVNFAGPKSRWQVKNRKTDEIGRKSRINQQSLGKRKHTHQKIGKDLAFEGPKPLEEILKRKRCWMSRDAPNDQVLEKGEIHEEGKDLTVNNEGYKSNTTAQNSEVEDGKTDASNTEDGDHEFEEEGYEPREGEWDYDLYEGDNGDSVDENNCAMIL